MGSNAVSTPVRTAWWERSWRPDPATVSVFSALAPGDQVVVVKLDPDGHEITRYHAAVAPDRPLAPWIEVVATWTHGSIDVAGLAFRDGDTLREFFSAEHPFNAFAVFSPDGDLRGWYGNVTYPAFVVDEGETRTIVWHDLYLDVVVLSDDTTHVLDDEELAASGLAHTSRELHDAVVRARDDLIAEIPSLIRGQGIPANRA